MHFEAKVEWNEKTLVFRPRAGMQTTRRGRFGPSHQSPITSIFLECDHLEKKSTSAKLMRLAFNALARTEILTKLTIVKISTEEKRKGQPGWTENVGAWYGASVKPWSVWDKASGWRDANDGPNKEIEGETVQQRDTNENVVTAAHWEEGSEEPEDSVDSEEF